MSLPAEETKSFDVTLKDESGFSRRTIVALTMIDAAERAQDLLVFRYPDGDGRIVSIKER